MSFGKQRQQPPPPELQRQSSDESYSSTTTSPSKIHRRTPSFNGWKSICPDGSDSDVSVKSSNTKATDPLNVSWRSNSGSGALSQVDMMDCSPERKSGRRKNLADQEDKSLHVLELIRQLSFSPSRKTKKRTDTDDMASSPSPKKQNTSPIGFELKYLQDSPPSPLLGLQYLPDGDVFML